MFKHVFKDFGNFRRFGRKKVKRIYKKIHVRSIGSFSVSLNLLT